MIKECNNKENSDHMDKRMNKEELINLLNTIKVDKEEFWILSSSSLVLRGIYPDAGDLDIAITPKGLEGLKKNYNLVQKENGWYKVTDKIECIYQENSKYPKEKLSCGYYTQNIYEYLEYLKSSTREKDIKRIPIVEKYIKNNYNIY